VLENLLLTFAVALLCGIALAASAGGRAQPAAKADFFVAPKGNDAWSGKSPAPNADGTDGPFATLARARAAVRELKARPLRRDLTVLLRGGRYPLARPLVFGPEDGGTKGHSVTYAAYPGERPILSGGRAVTGWKKSAGHLWTAEPAGVKAGKWHFTELFVSGRRARRARSPNKGFYRVVSAGPDGRTSFSFRQGDLRRHGNLRDVEIVFLHDWSISRIRVKDVDEEACTVRLTDPIGAGLGFFQITGFEPHPRYLMENARELLDEPGEWYLDRKTGLLSYWPAPGEKLAEAEVVAPVIERLLEVTGDAPNGKFVENLHFVGLGFAHCAWPRPAHGYAAGQAGFHDARTAKERHSMRARVPAAVEFEAARNCSFENGRIEHVGGAGIRLRGLCRGCRIVGSVLADIAGNGVMIGEPGQDPKATASDNVVSNNYIHHCGAEFYGCVGVWAGITDGTVVSHNEICHLPYTGVSVGWCWDAKPTPCRANRVEFNHIHHVMQILSDGGGIYTLGRQPETLLRGNLIHDVPPNAGRAESNGMFIDEGSALILIQGNTIYATAKTPIRFHKATTNTIRGNTLVVPGGQKPFMFNACREDSMTYQDNTVVEAKSFKPPQPSRLQAGPEPAYRKILARRR